MQQPLVSFLSPCYNHSKYIVESLDSVRLQTYSSIQHIIIDDCSKDDSVYKIQDWIEKNEYKCQFIRHKTNKGISYSLNESIEMAEGEFWSPLATDDFITPDRTQIFVTHLLQNQLSNMVTSDCRFIDENSNEIVRNGTNSFLEYHTGVRNILDVKNDYGTYKSLLLGNYIPSSIMLRMAVFKSIGLFDTDLNIEDWDMWLKVAQVSRIGYIDEALTYYRAHNTNSISNIHSMESENLKVFFKQYTFCKNNGLLKTYEKIYLELLKNCFDLKGVNTNSKLFYTIGPKSLLFKAFVKKALNKFKTK